MVFTGSMVLWLVIRDTSRLQKLNGCLLAFIKKRLPWQRHRYINHFSTASQFYKTCINLYRQVKIKRIKKVEVRSNILVVKDEKTTSALLFSCKHAKFICAKLFKSIYIPFLLSNKNFAEAMEQAMQLLNGHADNNDFKLKGAGFMRQIYDSLQQRDSAYYYAKNEIALNVVISNQMKSQRKGTRGTTQAKS